MLIPHASAMALLGCLTIPACAAAAVVGDDGSDTSDVVADAHANVASLDLPGAFFPESVAVAKHGALFTGNPTNGEIVTFAPGATAAKTFVAAGVNKGSFGMIVDDERRLLWACDVDLSPAATPSHLRAFRLADGVLDRSFDVPTGGACADIAIGSGGTLYVTDTFRSTIMRLQRDATRLEADWCTHPGFAGIDRQNPLKLNGIAFVQKAGSEALFVSKRDSGQLLRVPIVGAPASEKKCGAPLDVKLDRALALSDGIRAVDFDTVLVTVNAKSPEAVAAGGPIAGALLRVSVKGDTGRVSVIDDTLNQPSGVVVSGKSAWVSEGQILRLIGIDKTPPTMPFKLRRVALR